MRVRLLGLWILVALAGPALAQSGLEVDVTFDRSVADKFTGRVYLLFSQRREPRFGPGWFSPDPFAATDVKGWEAGKVLTVKKDTVVCVPMAWDEIARGRYLVQAVLRLNPDSPDIGTAPGNAFSKAVQIEAGDRKLELRIDQVVPERAAFQSDRVKEFVLRSELLSKFHKRDVVMMASVILPPNYAGQPERRWPVEYWIGGFGSGHGVHRRSVQRWDAAPRSEDIARVVLNPKCYGGHHVFADSANNGPRGKALVEEFIPALEKEFRFVSARTARFLSGHSSGGWSSLWLQITYPGTFGGTWSLAPDPVDFRSFQNPDIYRVKANLFTDRRGRPIPLAQRNGRAFYFTKQFSDMEVVYGEGGQLRSFEWVFSPRGPDGLPIPLYDRKTGAIDAAVAEAWKKYDIGLVLKENWKTLGPRLRGAIHVYCGDEDTFYLHPAVVRLKKTMKKLRSDAVIELHKGKDHSTVATRKLKERIREEMLRAFDSAHGKPKR